GDDRGVDAVDAHRIKRVKPGKALSALAAEGHVMPDPFDGAARLGPANYVAMRQVLVFEANCRLGEYPDLSQLPQRASRQSQSLASLIARPFTTSHAYLLARFPLQPFTPLAWHNACSASAWLPIAEGALRASGNP